MTAEEHVNHYTQADLEIFQPLPSRTMGSDGSSNGGRSSLRRKMKFRNRGYVVGERGIQAVVVVPLPSEALTSKVP